LQFQYNPSGLSGQAALWQFNSCVCNPDHANNWYQERALEILGAMSTSSQRARVALAAAAGAYLEAGVVVNPGGDRARRLAAAEAAAAQAAQAAWEAAAAAQEAAATAAALRAEVDREPRAYGRRSPDPRRGSPSRSPERHRRAQSPSPAHRRGRGGRRGSPVVQTVYKDGGAGTPWPMLTKSNYHEWSTLMRLKMQARQLWDAVEYGDLPYHDDRRALEAIIAGVPQDMQVSLADKLTAKDASDSIAAARIGVDRVRRATLQRLRKEWENLSFHPGEHIEDFALRLATLKQQMILHGERNMDEERAVEKLLRATPRKYAQLKVAIETLLDFQDLTIEEVIGRLKTVDDLDDDPAHEPVSVGGKLMLTEEQWLACQKKKDAGGASGSASSSGEAR